MIKLIKIYTYKYIVICTIVTKIKLSRIIYNENVKKYNYNELDINSF